MPQRDQVRLVFETLDQDDRVRVIVVRAVGEHFSSGGNIGGFMEATPETATSARQLATLLLDAEGRAAEATPTKPPPRPKSRATTS